jgi:hypothetical protein
VRTARGYLVKNGDLRFRESEQLPGLRRLRLRQLHLAEDGTNDRHRRKSAYHFANMLPAPAFLALDIE